jgi:uncharacterized protein YbjT (DUF2867 family)
VVTKVLVSGATGNVGSRVVQELRGRGVSIRAFVRDPDRAAKKLGDGVELALGDFSDAASLQRALEGADRLFLTSADGPQKVEHESAVIDAAASAGASRIVKLSTLGAKVGSPLPPFDWHGRIEEHLRRSEVPAVILRSTFFMSNLLGSAEAIKHTSKLFAPANAAGIAMVDPWDVAAVAAVVLTTEGHEGQTYELTGPEAITYEHVAEELSAAIGRPIEFVDVPEEAARQGFVEAGMPDWLVEHLIGVFKIIREDALEQTIDSVRILTAREPRSFAEFAREHAGFFQA